MRKVTFYTHVNNRLSFVFKLVKTVYDKGEPLLVWLPDDALLQQLDHQLWSLVPESFLPHELVSALEEDAGGELAPILLGAEMALPNRSDFPQVILNLSEAYVHEVPHYQRVLEIVGPDEDDLVAARDRFRAYREAGFTIEHHNMGHIR
ncbi:MAG: DNA polymerase III subunit chi [Neisseriaceae bacterium]|nr:DNA polymerase III subunit chi [Neisseriaceae bacterium]